MSYRSVRIIAAGASIVFLILAGLRLWSGGYLDRDPVWEYPAAKPVAPVAVLLFSGDAGLRKGMGPYIATALAAHGVDTTGISTSTLFRFGVDRARLDAIVTDAIRQAEKKAGDRRLVVIGQSYGADILQTGLSDLPAELRAKIAQIILVVPGVGTYYRADPSGLLYDFTPDSKSILTASRLRWAPVTCIYGKEDSKDLCPILRLPGIDKIALPGGHYMNHDRERVARIILRAVAHTAIAR